MRADYEPTQLIPALSALASVCSGFFSADEVTQGTQVVQPAELPPTARDLLVHQEHMTVRLQTHHGRPVRLQVLSEEIRDGLYRRMILLFPEGANQAAELGIVQIELDVLSEEVRTEVLSHRAPLGEILIRHNVLREVEPQWYLRFDASSPIAARLYGSDSRVAYGRVAMIHSVRKAAIRLLEVVPVDE